MIAKKHDPINPAHYNQGPVECIDIMRLAFSDQEVSDYCKINAFKYIWRCVDKNGAEDLEKATWYINKAKELDGYSTNTVELLEIMVEKARVKIYE